MVLVGCAWFGGLLASLVVVGLACYCLLGGGFAGGGLSGCVGLVVQLRGWFDLVRCAFAGLICCFAGLLWSLILCCF